MSTNTRNGNTLLESGFFPPCRVATTAAIALAGLQAIDGVTVVEGDRVLVKDQADAKTNGIYAASSGNWVRTTDAASNAQFFLGMAVIVAQGTSAGLTYICTATDDPVVIGTSSISWASQAAVANALQSATSTSSAALTTGAKTFVMQSGKSFAAQQWVLIYETANPDNCLLAEITSYTGTSLVVSVAAVGGTGGPYTDWSIALTNTPSAAGRQPPIGTGNVTGPGSSVSGNLATFSGTTGKVLTDSGLPAGALAGRTTLLYGDGGTKAIGQASLADGAGARPYVAAQPNDNLSLVNDGINPNTDIQINPGRCPDDADLTYLQLAAIMLKRIDTAWAAGGNVGNRQGMLLSGSSWLASKTYHLWLIAKLGQAVTQRQRTSNVATLTVATNGLGVGNTVRIIGVGGGYDGVAALTAVGTNSISYANTGSNESVVSAAAAAIADAFDVGATQQDAQAYPGATLPSGWTAKQCLGSILTDGSKNVRPMTQYGDEFWLTTPILDVSAETTTGAKLQTLTVPLGIATQAIVLAGIQSDAAHTSANSELYLMAPAQTSESAIQGRSVVQAFFTGGSGNIQITNAVQVRVWTSTAAQLRANLQDTVGGGSYLIRTVGWRDPRRRLF